jgi:hypothetical protein
MTNSMVRIHNVETGEIIDRAMTNAEAAVYAQNVEESRHKLELQEQKATAKAALLERLGITAEEAELLLG